MSAETIRDHFVKFLGVDVGVSFVDADHTSQVILYRPDRLSDAFVRQAYASFEKTNPDIAQNIKRLIVSFETRSGRTQRRVDFPQRERGFPSAPVRAAMS
jgi:hypothetical protein